MDNEVFLLGLIVGLFISAVVFFSYKAHIKKLNKIVLTQFYLSDISDFWKGKPRKVKDLPDFLERYFLYITQTHDFISQSEFITDNEEIKQQLEGRFNFHVRVGNVRVSTFITFTDTENVLVYERDNPNIKQGVINSKKDCFGAVAFNNLSLLFKLPKDFWNEAIIEIELIPGVAFEYMRGGDTAIMIGIRVVVSPESLLKAENEFNAIYKLENIDKQAIEMTSKLRLTIGQRYD